MNKRESYIDKHKVFLVLSIWFILTQTFPPINIYLPVPSVLRFPIFVGITMVFFPELLLRKSLVAMFVYIAMAFLFFVGGNSFYGQIGRITNPLLDMSAGLLMVEYVLKYDINYKYTRIVTFIVIIANVVMSITSIPQIYAYPDILRFSSKEDAAERFGSVLYWLIPYGTCHGLPLLFAPLVFLCRKMFRTNKMLFVFWTFSTAVLFYVVYLSNATTALLVSVIMLILSVLLNTERFNQKNIITLGLIGLLAVVFSSQSVSIPILDLVQSNMDESWSNYHKIEEFKYSIMYGDSETGSDISTRSELYTNSLELFIKSPIIGTQTPEKIGHHSWFLDNLACFGMFLIWPIILMLVYNIKSVYRQLIHTKAVYSYGVFALIFLLLLKNEFGQGTWLYGFAFLPILCRYIDYVFDYKTVK